MPIVTTLYDLIEVVTAQCSEDLQVALIVQALINSGRDVLLEKSIRLKVVASDYSQGYVVGSV